MSIRTDYPFIVSNIELCSVLDVGVVVEVLDEDVVFAVISSSTLVWEFDIALTFSAGADLETEEAEDSLDDDVDDDG